MKIERKKEEVRLSPMTKAFIPTEMSNGQSDNTKTSPKSSITQRLRTNLGRSVGVTTATQLVLLIGLKIEIWNYEYSPYCKNPFNLPADLQNEYITMPTTIIINISYRNIIIILHKFLPRTRRPGDVTVFVTCQDFPKIGIRPPVIIIRQNRL